MHHTYSVQADPIVQLLAHDLRTPLGPIALATSVLEDDPSLTDDQRELARMAGAHAARAARLIDAVLASVRGPRAPVPQPTNLLALAQDALARYELLGGTGAASGQACVLGLDRELIRDALVNLAECAGGEGGSVRIDVARDGGGARIMIVGSDVVACDAALAATTPGDWRSALALGASALVRVHDGIVASVPGGVLVLIGSTA